MTRTSLTSDAALTQREHFEACRQNVQFPEETDDAAMASVPCVFFKNEGKICTYVISHVTRIRPIAIDVYSVRSPPARFRLTMSPIRVPSFIFGAFFLSSSRVCFHNSALSPLCSFFPSRASGKFHCTCHRHRHRRRRRR